MCREAFGAEPDDSVSYTYDKNGNVLTVTDANGTITRFYDKLNRVTKYSNHQGNVLQYAYNEVGNLVTFRGLSFLKKNSNLENLSRWQASPFEAKVFLQKTLASK